MGNDYLDNYVESNKFTVGQTRKKIKAKGFKAPTKGMKQCYIPELRLTVFYDPKKETKKQVIERKRKEHKNKR